MKNILLENMLRFGTKNINVPKLKYLTEQTDQETLDSAKAAVEADTVNKSTLQKAQQLGQCVIIKTLPTTKTTIDLAPIESRFFNNMVSLDKGLMQGNLALIDKQVQQNVAEILKFQPTTKDPVTVTILGQATNAQPYPDGYDQNKQKMPLDHPGQPYGGIDITQKNNYQAGNQYLADQRARSIYTLYAKYLAKQMQDKSVSLIPRGIVVTGDFADDALRNIKTTVTGERSGKDPVAINDAYLNFTCTYEEQIESSNAAKIKDKDTTNAGSAYNINDTGVGYRATLKITFGQKNAPAFSNNYFWKNQTEGQAVIPNTNLTRKGVNELIGMQGDVTGKQTSAGPDLNVFLKSCGYFTKEQAQQIYGLDTDKRKTSIFNVSSEVFKKLLAAKQGDIVAFAQAVGAAGTKSNEPNFRATAIVYDLTVTPPKVIAFPA